MTVTVTNGGPPPGVVAAYGFDAGSGTAVADNSGTGNNGTLVNATWFGATAGRFGTLSFNGSNASVTIPDSNGLDLTIGMTLEAWVRPATQGTTGGQSDSRSSRATTPTASTRAPTTGGRAVMR